MLIHTDKGPFTSAGMRKLRFLFKIHCPSIRTTLYQSIYTSRREVTVVTVSTMRGITYAQRSD